MMPHNLVIVAPGTLESVGAQAEAMASRPDGFQKNFVPATPVRPVFDEADHPGRARADPLHRSERSRRVPLPLFVPRPLARHERDHGSQVERAHGPSLLDWRRFMGSWSSWVHQVRVQRFRGSVQRSMVRVHVVRFRAVVDCEGLSGFLCVAHTMRSRCVRLRTLARRRTRVTQLVPVAASRCSTSLYSRAR